MIRYQALDGAVGGEDVSAAEHVALLVHRASVAERRVVLQQILVQPDLVHGVQGSGFRVQGSGFRVQGSGFRVQSSEFRVGGWGSHDNPTTFVRLTSTTLDGASHHSCSLNLAARVPGPCCIRADVVPVPLVIIFLK